MKILIICSKKFYDRIEKIKMQLESMGHEVYMPNCYDDPSTEEKYRAMGEEAHKKFKARMYKQSEDTIRRMDAVLVLNYDKEKEGIVYKNYLGGATFLEMYDAFRMGKKIFLMNSIPDNILSDEIAGFGPTVLNGDLNLIGKAVEQEVFDWENYLMWLSSFSELYPEFYDDELEYSKDPVVSEEDKVNVKNLYKLYQLLEEKILDNHNIGDTVECDIKFKFDNLGFLISCDWSGDDVKYHIKSVALGAATTDFIDIEEILYNEDLESVKHFVNRPKTGSLG